MKITAYQLAVAYATGNSCPIKVIDRLYEQINDASYAFISLTKDLAYMQAEAAKDRWQRGSPLSIFDGVPIAYKDLFDIKHTITTAGARVRLHSAPATQDAHCVSTLHRMGLICVGKTNLSEFAYSGLGLNPHFGTPTNVVNPSHVAGGSSSGSATVVGHGIVPLAMGTDTAGSIRIPASFNGLVGFRASCERYNKQGVFPLADSLDTIGPIAHDVLDCLLMDNLLNNKPSLDWLGVDYLIEFTRSQAIPTLVFDPEIVALADDDVQGCFNQWVDKLVKVGFPVIAEKIGVLHDTLMCINEHWLGSAEAYALHEDLLNGPEADLLDGRVRARLMLAKNIKASTQIRLYARRITYQRALVGELGNRLLIMPTVIHTAPMLDKLEADDDYFAQINTQTLRLTMIGSFLDMPSLSLPIGTDRQGLPVGALLAGVAGGDKQVLVAGHLMENCCS